MVEFYKKNPEIPGTIFVQGESVGDGDVVAGEEFKMFADPNTFPGRPVKLIKVEFNDMTPEQVEQVKHLLGKQANKPPRHLGVIKSSQFSTTDEGHVKMHEEPKLPEPVAAKAPPKAKIVGEDDGKEDPEKPVLPEEKAPAQKALRDVYDEAGIADAFPGVTMKNAASVLDAFGTLEDLAGASNADLKKAGIPASYFKRLRNAVKAEVAGGAE